MKCSNMTNFFPAHLNAKLRPHAVIVLTNELGPVVKVEPPQMVYFLEKFHLLQKQLDHILLSVTYDSSHRAVTESEEAESTDYFLVICIICYQSQQSFTIRNLK